MIDKDGFEDGESLTREFLEELGRSVEFRDSNVNIYRQQLAPLVAHEVRRINKSHRVHLNVVELKAALAQAEASRDGRVIIEQYYENVGYITTCQVEVSTPVGWRPEGHIYYIDDPDCDP
jgi:hypothetical protein